MLRVKVIDARRKIDSNGMYQRYMANEHVSTDEIIAYQEQKKKDLLKFHLENNPGYVEFLKRNGISDFENIKWEELPIITKADLKGEEMIVKSNAHHLHHTGGSTGKPLIYALSRDCVSALWAAIWRAFSVLDVKPCEALVMVAGTSLFNKESLSRKVYNWLNRFHVVSAFDLNDETLKKTYEMMVRKNIKVVYGYTSSVLCLLKYFDANNIKLKLKGVFTTSEMMIPAVRELARKCCDCDVIDIYGANDGGILAFECKEHSGYHVSWERSFVEIIDNRIILTDLFNTSFPFLRYQVEDMTSADSLIMEPCKCGRTMFRLPDVSGRIFDMIKDDDGNMISSAFFTGESTANDKSFTQIQVVEKDGVLCVNFVSEQHDEKYYTQKYYEIFKQRINRELKIVVNAPIQVKKNGKSPIYVNLDKEKV